MPGTEVTARETDAVSDARRAMEVCNACRYCEGFCAVFPAMELRRDFAVADLDYLANLCHGCRGCFYACQYAPPHEFGINVPAAFAEVRHGSYAAHAWPQGLARMFERNGTLVCVATALGMAVVLLLTGMLQGADAVFGRHDSFYAVVPYGAMVAVASLAFLFALLALGMAGRNFWRATGGGSVSWHSVGMGLHDAFTLKNLGNSGDGCNNVGEAFSLTRRRFHHALFYGFLLCFGSTSVATIYHHGFGWVAPYPVFSLPVVLGLVGGLGMVAGCAGLIGMKAIADPQPSAGRLLGGDYALLFLLLLAAGTGLLLLAVRDTGAMGVTLAVHLGVILSFFLLMPYSRFVHGLYRTLALIRAAGERADG